MDSINIVLAADNNYAQHLAVTLSSILHNNKNEKFNIFIFEDKISEFNKKKIAQVASQFNCKITYVIFDATIFKNMHFGRFTIVAYYRLLMAKYINVDKILYLDVDIIVNKSIRSMYDIDIDNYYVAAVEDIWKPRNYCNKLKMDQDAKYFNSGVLLANLKKWKEDNLFEKFINFEKEISFEFESPDQDILNAIFNGKWKRLPLKYNQYEKNSDLDYPKLKESFTDNEIKEAQEDPVIIHYIGGRKPWHYRNEHIKKELYWKYLQLTPYKSYIPSDRTLKNIISKNTPKIIRNPKRFFKLLFANR